MRDILAILLVFILLFGTLYLRKYLSKRPRSFSNALVGPDFWKQRQQTKGQTTTPLIMWIAPNWLPQQQTAYELSKYLKGLGWSVMVLVPTMVPNPDPEIPVIPFEETALVERALIHAHALLVLGDAVATVAIETAKRARIPICAVGSSAPQALPLARIVHADYLNDGTALTVHPPFYPKTYQTHTDRKYITLIGCSVNQGAKEFYALSRDFPNYSFLAVQGANGEQLVPPKLPNLRAVKSTPDLRGVYSQTGILLILGGPEEFPRRALEAAASGIPTVGISSAGLQEALGPAGIFCETMEEIADAIRKLREFPEEYEAASRAAKKRAANAYNSTEELERFRSFLLELPANYRDTL